ncbi:MAG: E3 binding domain-containing protein, partial [Caulobacteraceae bacterium]|nr:E3 binding domain-containing protein [Caulobacteraceae bacterium]
MADILTPALGESVTEATIAKWTKSAGEAVTKDEILVELETDKVSLEVVAPADGVLAEIRAEAGATVVPGTVLGVVTEGAAAAAPKPEAKADPAPAAVPANTGSAQIKSGDAPHLSPAVQRVVSETGVDPKAITPTGPKGNVTKADAVAAAAAPKA